MEKSVIVAPVGDNMDALFIGLKEFPTEKIILLASPGRLKDAEKAVHDLSRFRVPVKVFEIKGNIWEGIFSRIAEIKESEDGKSILVNTATGDRLATSAVTSAAFVNGIKAFSVDDGSAMMLPVLRFSYYKMLTDKKMEILKTLNKPGCCISLEHLRKKTKMSLPLISYHINGNLKSEGMKGMGLVETVEKKGRMEIRLSTLGRMLVKGYVS